MPVNSFENYPMSWKPEIPERTKSIYKYLAGKLAADIRSGALKPGDLMPPQRELADYLDINLSTVSRTYKYCEQKGLLCARIGQGTFVSSDVQISGNLLKTDPAENIIEMGVSHPHYGENKKVIDEIKRLVSAPDAPHFLEYISPIGTRNQRKIFAEWLSMKYKLELSEENIIMSSGTQIGLSSALLGLLHYGDKIATDPFTYTDLKNAAKLIGIRLVPVAWADGEMSADALRKACDTSGIKGIYLVPDGHNPTTHTMSLKNRHAIAEVAREKKLIIFEDCINSLFQENLRPSFYKLLPEQTLSFYSLAKAVCAGPRISAIVVPEKYCVQIENAIGSISLTVNPFMCEIMGRLVGSGAADELINRQSEMMHHRYEIATKYLEGLEFEGSPYCNFLWLKTAPEYSSEAFEKAALEKGVQVYGAEYFSVGAENDMEWVRVCFTAPKTEGELIKGLTTIRNILV